MPRISPDGKVAVSAPAVLTTPKTNTKRLLGDWLREFLDYTSELESPVEFLRWAGLSTIAGAAQRKIFAETQAYMAFPNLYVTLVGPAGSKKSTAIRQGARLLKKLPGINMCADAPSVAGIMLEYEDIGKSNKEHQSLNAFIYELSSLYENAQETMTGFLTAIYDGDNDYLKRTRSGGKEAIARPWLNLIAGTTPTWLGDNLSRSAVEGGLVARTLYIYSEDVIIKSPFPRVTPELKRMESALTNDLAHISALYGTFDFEGGAEGDAYRWYDAWYRDRKRLPRVSDNRTAGYFTRKPQHLLKVAMLVELSKGDHLRFTVQGLEIALMLLDSIEPGMTKAFSSVGGNTFASDLERIQAQIRGCAREGMTYAELVAGNYHQLAQRELLATLEYLMAMKRVYKVPIKDSPTGEKVFVAAEYLTISKGVG